MKLIGVIFAVGSVAFGLWAAWLWWRASKIEIRPYIEPTGYEPQAWADEARRVLPLVGELNARAALWTAVAVACGAVSTALGYLSSN